MSIVKKTIEVMQCDLCNNREDKNDEVIRNCIMCGRDFCTSCGDVYVQQYGSMDFSVLTLCKDCLKQIVKFNDEDEEYEEEEVK